MRCPNCKVEISRVRVYSECWEYGFLEGNTIVAYGSIEDVSETPTAMVCDECEEDIGHAIEQKGQTDART
jgi:hypothetical protein